MANDEQYNFQKEYLVKWKDSDERSWTPEKNIDSRQPIDEYERRVQHVKCEPATGKHEGDQQAATLHTNENTQELQQSFAVEQPAELPNIADLLKTPVHDLEVSETIETLQSSPIKDELSQIARPELLIQDEPMPSKLLQSDVPESEPLEEESQDVQMAQLEPVQIHETTDKNDNNESNLKKEGLPKVPAVPMAEPHTLQPKPQQTQSSQITCTKPTPLPSMNTQRPTAIETQERPTILNHNYAPELNTNYSVQQINLYRSIVNGKAREDCVEVIDLIRPVGNGKALCLVQNKAAKMWVPFEPVKNFYPMPLIKYYETRIMWTNIKK